MNRTQIVEALTERLGDAKVAAASLDAMIDVINRTIAKGEKVTITGFGSFEKIDRPARTARNPQTGATIKIKKTSVPKFRAGAGLKSVANGTTKLGREPKHVPLLPSGVLNLPAVKEALAGTGATPAKKAAPAAKKAAAPAKKAAPAKAAAPAKKAAPAKAAAPAKKAPAKKAPAAKKAAAPAKAAPAKKAPAAKKAAPAAKKAAPAKKAPAAKKAAPAKKAPAKKVAAKK